MCLGLAGVTASAQATIVGEHVRATTLSAAVESDARSIAGVLNAALQPSDFTASLTDSRRRQLAAALGAVHVDGRILGLELRTPSGSLIVATGASPPESSAARSHDDFEKAAMGESQASLVTSDLPSQTGTTESGSLIRELLPLRGTDGAILAIVEAWRDAAPVLAQIDLARGEVVAVTLAAAIVLAVVLFLVFRAAQDRISRQTIALVEAERIDHLTSLPNHGAIVTRLASEIDALRALSGSTWPLEVGLIDVDNFRLLNDTYGHAAGDHVLLTLAARLTDHLSGATVGRYGPDEFLVIAHATDERDLERALEAFRLKLADEALEFEGSERLPISVSAGIAGYPGDAGSATELLSVAAAMLGEAASSGGDAIRRASGRPAAPHTGGYDVLKGLVLAIDGKDRYTKRHSEDVARYGVLIAQRIGLPDDEIRTIRTAGLLHDIGKIGIPDDILRKPGKLTAEEMAVVQEHVRLGDLIVRDLPDLDRVRDGIRYHHERIDGKGYLERLAGDEIPLIGRILAVADAFSAMTTTRPYRKSLPIQEALRRLGDAAGTHLDEPLVVAFLAAMDGATDRSDLLDPQRALTIAARNVA